MPSLSVPRRLLLSWRTNFTFNFVGKLAYAGSRALLLIMIAKLGTAAMVGQFSLAFAITTPVFMISDLDLRSVLVTDFKKQYQFGHYMGLRLLTVVPALTAVGILALFQKSALTGSVILLVGFAKAVELVCDMLYGLMQREERLDKLGLSLILKSVLSVVLVGLLLWRFRSIAAGAAGLAAAYLVVLLVYDIRTVRPYEPLKIYLDRRVLLHLLRLCLPLGLVLLLGSLNKNLSVYFINSFLGSNSLGYYSAAVYIMSTGSMAVSALGQSRNARLAKLFGSGDNGCFVRILGNMLIMTGLLGVSMILIAVLFGGNILTFLYTPEYAAYQNLLILVMVAAAVSYMGETVQYAVTATRQFWLQPLAYGLVLLVGLIINPILIKRFQLNGASWSLIAASCLQLGVNTLLLSYMLRKKRTKQVIERGITGQRELEVRETYFPNSCDSDFILSWKQLRKCGTHTVFSDPDFLSVWWEHFGKDSTPLTLGIYTKGELAGVIPLMLTKGPGIRRCRLIGYPQATLTDIVLRPEAAEEGMTAVLEFLDELAGPILFEIEGLSVPDTAYGSLLHRLKILKRGLIMTTAPCSFICVGGQTYESYVKSQFSSHTRKNNRRDEERLNQMGVVTCRELAAADMPEAYDLHDRRWARKLDTSRFCREPSRSFFIKLLELPHDGLQVRALGLYLDGRMIAFQYGFICGGRATLYKSAHMELLSIFAPGKRMKREYISRLFDENLETVDLGIGYEEYKTEWTHTNEEVKGLLFPKRDLSSRILFIPYAVKAAIRNELKKHRWLVLLKRNGLGKLKYCLSPKTAGASLHYFLTRISYCDLPVLLGEALRNCGRSTLQNTMWERSANPRYAPEKARIFDAPELALLFNRSTENIVRGFFRGHAFYVLRRQGKLVFGAEVVCDNGSAEIIGCRVHRRLIGSDEVSQVLANLHGILVTNAAIRSPGDAPGDPVKAESL